MEFANLSDTKRETKPVVAGDLYSNSTQDLLGDISFQNTNGSEQNILNPEKVDVNLGQQLTVGVKAVDDELGAKFSQAKENYGDYFDDPSNVIKPDLAAVTNNFMNSERGFMGESGDGLKNFNYENNAIAVNDLMVNEDNLNNAVDLLTTRNNDKDNEDIMEKMQNDTNNQNQHLNDESPSISYNSSPTKRSTAIDAFKKQEEEEFISSEDLLGDSENQPSPYILPNENTYNKPAGITATTTTNQENIVSTKEKIVKSQQQLEITSIEDIFHRYGLDAWFKPERLHPQVESLIYWRDVKKSGVVFGLGLVTLLAVSCFSVISVVAYLSLMVLSATIAFRTYKSIMQIIQKTPDGHPFKELLEYDVTLSPEKAQQITAVTVAHLNGFITEMRRLFLVENGVDSIKFGVILCVMTYIGAWFNGMTLVILAFVSLFTLPKVYENNKQSIDSHLDLARSKLAEITDKIKATLSIGTKKPIAAESDKDK